MAAAAGQLRVRRAARIGDGRNLADGYFLRGTPGHFIDFDLMLAGSAVPEMSRWFAMYWNSAAVYPVQAIVCAATYLAPTTPRARSSTT